MSEIEILQELKKQLIIFFDELISQFPEEGDLIVMRLFLTNQIPIKDIMDNFILKINMDNQKLRNMIKTRNETFFLEHDIFEQLDQQKVSHFKRIWRSGNLDEDDKDTIWCWIDTFIKLADMYINIS